MARKPADSPEIDKLEKSFDKFDAECKSLTLDGMNQAPKQEMEPQTKMSVREQQKAKEVRLKPTRTIGCRDKFNERFRESYDFDKTYVNFIAEHKEIIGETIEMWTRPYGGIPAEFWQVPTNTPVWAPRYVAEQIKRKTYHRLVMMNKPVEETQAGTLYGTMVADQVIPRLDAHPVSSAKSVFF